MELEEREVEGFHCSALLVPRDWTLRAHYDVRSDGSVLAVAHLEEPDCMGSTLYIAQHCVPHAIAAATMQQLHEKLRQCQRRAVTAQHVWEERVTGAHTLVLCVALFAASPDTAHTAIAAVARIAVDLRERLHQYSNASPVQSSEEWDAGCLSGDIAAVALCSSRGRCVLEVRSALRFGSSPRHARIVSAAAQLGLEPETFAETADAGPLLLAVLPNVSYRVWAARLRTVPGCAELMATRTTVRPNGVEARGHFVYIPPGIIAWRMEARVGSDCCVVLLAESPLALPTEEGPHCSTAPLCCTLPNSPLDMQSPPVAQCRGRCAWLRAHVSLRVATDVAWSPLCRGEMGAVVRCGSLVVRVPHGVATAEALPMPRATLGGIALRGMDDDVAREVTITLLRDFRSAADFAEFAQAEFAYDKCREGVVETLRRRKVSAGPRSTAETHMLWLRLSAAAAVYLSVRDCGSGRLLLAQALVRTGFDETEAERWEHWVDAIEAAPVK